MSRKGSRPRDGRPSRDRRPGRAGIGPGPAYRPSSSGGGTKHQPGSSTDGCAVIAIAMVGILTGAFGTFVYAAYRAIEPMFS